MFGNLLERTVRADKKISSGSKHKPLKQIAIASFNPILAAG